MIEKVVLNGEEHKLSPEYKDIRNKPSINGVELKEGDNKIEIIDVNIDPDVDIVEEGETPSVVNIGTPKNPTLKFSLPKGDKGDTGKVYVPTVDEESGDLEWSLEDTPQEEIDSTNIKGPQGERGIGLGVNFTKSGKVTTLNITTDETTPQLLKTLQINDGNDGHNPCLGRLNAIPASFTAAFPNAIKGDYVYVDLYNDTTQTTTTTIYHYALNDNTLEWDNGIEIDAEHPILASGQAVTAIYIKDKNGNNDLEAQAVLSADAGKELNEQINGSEEIVVGEELVANGKLLDPNQTYYLIGIDVSTNELIRGSMGAGAVLNLSGHNYKFKITGINDANQGIISFFIKNPADLSSYTYTLQQLKDAGYVDSDATDLFKWCAKGTSKEFEIPESANYLYVATRRTTNIDCFPVSANFIDLAHTEGASEKLNKLEDRVDVLEENTAALPELELSVDSIKELLIDDSTVELMPNDFITLKIYPGTGVWNTSYASDASLYRNVKKGQILHIEGKSDRAYTSGSCIAFVPSVPTSGASFAYSQGTGFYRVAAGESLDITVENDCILYVWYHPDSITNLFPTKVTIRTISAKDGERSVEITRGNVNLVDEAKIVAGILDSNGEIVSGSGKVTDFLRIKIARSTQFIHACSVDSNGSFGYNAVKFATYSLQKELIGVVDLSSAEETFWDKLNKESQDDELFDDVFTDAYYVRVQFPASSSELYVCNANDRNLPVYSKYNEKDLYQTTDFVADKIHNSDGALTKMLQAALTYVGKDEVNGLGYGDSNTAFDQEVNAVEADSWDSYPYTGEKKQINCSGFVMLALQGIFFENSRYVLGSSRKNIVTNYVFDSKTTYNYPNAKYINPEGSQHNNAIACSDFGKLYAETLCRYAEDRGYMFKINDDLSNLEVGDVIFSGNTSGSYRKIGHTSFVCGVRANIDGSKIVDIMQNSHTTSISRGKTTRASLYNNSAKWAARFPMPDSHVAHDSLVTSFTNDMIADVTTSEQLLSTLTLSKTLKKENVYTIVGKLSSNPLGKIQPIVKVSGTTFDGNETTLVQRPDGWFVKHIIIAYSDNLSTLTDVKVYIKGSEAINSADVQLEEVALYKGYITI